MIHECIENALRGVVFIAHCNRGDHPLPLVVVQRLKEKDSEIFILTVVGIPTRHEPAGG